MGFSVKSVARVSRTSSIRTVVKDVSMWMTTCSAKAALWRNYRTNASSDDGGVLLSENLSDPFGDD
jgi:hypothetical protein